MSSTILYICALYKHNNPARTKTAKQGPPWGASAAALWSWPGPRRPGGRARPVPWLRRLALALKRRDASSAAPDGLGAAPCAGGAWTAGALATPVATGSQRGALERCWLRPAAVRAGLPPPPAGLPAPRHHRVVCAQWLALERSTRYAWQPLPGCQATAPSCRGRSPRIHPRCGARHTPAA